MRPHLARLRWDGATPEAFTFRRPVPAPDEPAGRPATDDRWTSPA